MKRSEVDAEAKRLLALNIPWSHRGRTKGGADCIGMIMMVGEQFGVPYVDMSGYSKAPDGRVFLEHLRKFLIVGQMPVKVGQVAILRDNRFPCHCGIITQRYGQLRMIHCSAAHKKITESALDPKFWSEFRMVFEFPGIEED